MTLFLCCSRRVAKSVVAFVANRGVCSGGSAFHGTTLAASEAQNKKFHDLDNRWVGNFFTAPRELTIAVNRTSYPRDVFLCDAKTSPTIISLFSYKKSDANGISCRSAPSLSPIICDKVYEHFNAGLWCSSEMQKGRKMFFFLSRSNRKEQKKNYKKLARLGLEKNP